MIGILEAVILARKGYIVDNVRACRLYKAGKISQQEMWSIINKNIGVRTDPVVMIPIINKTKPWKGNWVSFGEGKGPSQNGYIAYVAETYIGVKKSDGEFVLVELDEFTDHSSKGGRTTWYIQE